MKRFSARETAILCSPLVILAGASWLARNRAKSPEEKLRLEFHVEKPTTLEAFDGVDAALVVDLKGPNTTWGNGRNPLRVFESDYWLELGTRSGKQKSRANGESSDRWGLLWKGNMNNSRFTVDLDSVPAGALRFGIDAKVVPASSPNLLLEKAARLSGKWKVDRAAIKPTRFGAIGRPPLVALRSASIVGRGASYIRGEAVFDLLSPEMNDRTRLDLDFSNDISSYGGASSLSTTKQSATRRVIEWSVSDPRALDTGAKPIVRVTGRASADNRWPLAFKIEPFDFGKVKVGQKLNFRAWPVPTPKK